MKFDLLPPHEQLVQIMSRIYRYGLTTTSGGNLSILDENGDMWITPAAIDKGNLQPRDIILIKPDETAIGPHKPSSEYPFHQSIFKKRPDIKAIVHAHAPSLTTFSIVRKIPDTRIIPQAHHVCGQVGYAPYALPGSRQLGENIANTFAQGYDAVLLENHGVVTVGPDLLTAFHRLETLDFCARTQIHASGLGKVNTLSDEQIALFEQRKPDLPTFTPQHHSSRERELRQALCSMVHRAYDQGLMTSTEGTASARVDADSFLISPYGVDRRYLDIEDIVLVNAGRAEAGKLVSRAAKLHQVIYADHPEIECVITAQVPNAMAYSVTDCVLETKTIPESYVVLRDVPRIPYGQPYQAPEKVSAVLSKNVTAAIIENDTVLATGGSIHQAFDRLEVADFTAASLISSLNIGQVVPIGQEEIEDLKVRFFGSTE